MFRGRDHFLLLTSLVQHLDRLELLLHLLDVLLSHHRIYHKTRLVSMRYLHQTRIKIEKRSITHLYTAKLMHIEHYRQIPLIEHQVKSIAVKFMGVAKFLEVILTYR